MRTLEGRIERLSLGELRRLDSWLHQVIEDRQQPPEEQRKQGREVITRIVTRSGTLQLEMVRCGKAPRCRSCPHGPYWYRYWKADGRTRSKYVGKASREQRSQYAAAIDAARWGEHSPVVSSRSSRS